MASSLKSTTLDTPLAHLPSFKDAMLTQPDEVPYFTWRVIAHNPAFTGECEGFGFSNGEAVVPALPRSARCHRAPDSCMGSDNRCRFHNRLVHLSTLAGYPYYEYEQSRNGRYVARERSTFDILSEDEYSVLTADIDEQQAIAEEIEADLL